MLQFILILIPVIFILVIIDVPAECFSCGKRLHRFYYKRIGLNKAFCCHKCLEEFNSDKFSTSN